MRIISFVVPCYNSQDYLHKCMGTLLKAGSDVEIILVNDGSTDNTPKMCDEYAKQYPDIVRVVHQENGGHGEGVNQGLRHAKGVYYKVVDSDDWADETALLKIVEKLKYFAAGQKPVDMFIANYVYENPHISKQKVIRYQNVFPVDKVVRWEDTRGFGLSQYLLMHSVFYRTEVLRKSGIQLPKHTFYVDNIFVYAPLPYVETIYYMDVDFYRYAIGREDQSVNEKVMIKRIDQQISITKTMISSHDLRKLKQQNPKLAKYMVHYLSMMMVVTSIMLVLADTPESLEKLKNLWGTIKAKDPALYRKLRYRSLAVSMNFPGKVGRKVSVFCYRLAHSLFRFN